MPASYWQKLIEISPNENAKRYAEAMVSGEPPPQIEPPLTERQEQNEVDEFAHHRIAQAVETVLNRDFALEWERMSPRILLDYLERVETNPNHLVHTNRVMRADLEDAKRTLKQMIEKGREANQQVKETLTQVGKLHAVIQAEKLKSPPK